jgi:hypothetical protein
MKIKHGLMVIALGFLFTSCASGPRTARMTTSQSIPGAQGSVKSSKGDNGNTSLEVEVKHLASPEQVAAGATTYVVWARPRGAGPSQNLGALRVDDDLRGTLKTVTPLQSFDVFITAEDSPTAMRPTNEQLLMVTIQH